MTSHKELFAFAVDIARKDAAQVMEIAALKAYVAELKSLLERVIGEQPDKWGYRAAFNVMNAESGDQLRHDIRAALAGKEDADQSPTGTDVSMVPTHDL